ncbi:MAG: hypothetical protein J6334_06610 [Kiritimatiellae bacterium]|nr:hypothetical protein [Kiritimatiellia bacterium]
MKTNHYLLVGILLVSGIARAEGVRVRIARNQDGDVSHLRGLSAPAKNDAASRGTFTLLRGERDGNGGELAVLTDGRLPRDADRPRENFFMRGTGYLLLDLKKATDIVRIASFSRHPAERSPQVFTVYGCDSETPNRALEEKEGELVGWKTVVKVDTRLPGRSRGGFVAVSVDREEGTLGRYRYLLFKIEPTGQGPFDHTFYSEIDVVTSEDKDLKFISPDEGRLLYAFASANGKYRFTIDYTDAPELEAWSKQKLAPVVMEWYGKLVDLLPSEGFRPLTDIRIRFKDDMGGTPAYAAGREICLNHPWIVSELRREAVGSVVHEMTHVVQSYGRGPKRAPGWLTEGIADYTRWFLYEPQTRGARITKRHGNVRYDNSYRVTANFLDWCQRTYNKNLVRDLNAAARMGQYDEAIWKRATGKTVQELGEEWKKALPER